MRAGSAHQRTFLREQTFLAPNGVLIKQSRGQVEMDRLRSLYSLRLESLPHLCRTHKNLTPNSTGSPGRIETIDGTDGSRAKST
jgi:hypothetical protein